MWNRRVLWNRALWNRGLWRGLALPTALLGVWPLPALAQDGAIEASDTGDTAWLLSATALLLLAALPGLALFQAGRARPGTFVPTLVHAGTIAASVSVVWIAVGYTLAFGDVSSGWLGSGSAWMLIQLGNVRSGLNVPESAFALFQIACAMLAAVLVAGAWCGRGRFGWAVLFTGLWSMVVLAPVVHWLWGGGWLATTIGTTDYAGGLALCVTGGTSALTTAILMGPGLDFGRARGAGGLAPIALVGGLLMWAGWLGLCGGSAFAANDDAAAAVLSAHAAACAGALTRLAIDRLRGKAFKAEAFACGMIAGLAAIMPAALHVSPGAALVIGAVGSAVSSGAIRLVRLLGIDDRLDMFALFAAPAAAGALLLAPFMAPMLGGTGYDEGMNPITQLASQAIGLSVVMAWSAITTAIVALMASILVPMRLSEEAEAAQIDPQPRPR